MKKQLSFLAFLLILLWVACEPPIVFKNPQPEGIENSPKFAKAFQGTFICDSDSSIVVVNDNCIYKSHWYDFTLTKKQLNKDDNIVRSGEFLRIKDLGKCAIYKIENDTFFASVRLADTLFLLKENENILKSYQGHQVMNLKLKGGNYEVVILSLDKQNNLQLKLTTLPGELEKLASITPVEDVSYEDVEQYEINPTRMEFDEILKQEIVFETCEYFKRIKIPHHELYPF